MRSIVDAVKGATAGATVDLGSETLTAGDLRGVRNVTITGGTVIGETRCYSCTQLVWNGTRFQGGDPTVKTSGVIALLGGTNNQLVGCHVSGGGASGSIQIGLDIGQPDATMRVPTNWTVRGCVVESAGSAWIYPQNDCVYVLGTPGVPMNGLIKDCTFGPAPKGAILKIGGTGSSPLTEGSCGVTVENVKLVTGSLGPTDEKYTLCLQGRTSAITYRNVSADGPGKIVVADGPSAGFQNCRLPGHTFVSYYLPAWWLRWWRREEYGQTGRNYTGIYWQV